MVLRLPTKEFGRLAAEDYRKPAGLRPGYASGFVNWKERFESVAYPVEHCFRRARVACFGEQFRCLFGRQAHLDVTQAR